MKSYKDYCRPASPVERTEKRAGDKELINGRAHSVGHDPARERRIGP